MKVYYTSSRNQQNSFRVILLKLTWVRLYFDCNETEKEVLKVESSCYTVLFPWWKSTKKSRLYSNPTILLSLEAGSHPNSSRLRRASNMGALCRFQESKIGICIRPSEQSLANALIFTCLHWLEWVCNSELTLILVKARIRDCLLVISRRVTRRKEAPIKKQSRILASTKIRDVTN